MRAKHVLVILSVAALVTFFHWPTGVAWTKGALYSSLRVSRQGPAPMLRARP